MPSLTSPSPAYRPAASLTDRLIDYQTAALEVIDRGLAILNAAIPPADGRALATCRWELLRVLREYQLFKHRELFDPLIASGHASAASEARRLKAACVAIGEELRAYVLHWSAMDIKAQWSTYRPAALAMAKRLRDHMIRERSGVALLEIMAGR